jgi:hypothetical protein
MRLKDRMTLRELSDHIGISVGMLTSEMKKAGVARRVRVATTSDDSSDSASQLSRRSGSKDDQIEKLFHLLGKVPDSEVARLADVSVRTIASYRARNGIDGYKGPRRRPAPRGRRASKLEDFRHMLGKLPDRVVAEEAGMSLGAVRNFRVKHDIPAAGRMPRSEIDVMLRDLRLPGDQDDEVEAPEPAAVAAPAFEDDSLPPEPGEEATPVVAAPVVVVPASGRAWRMTFCADDGERTVIVVADGLVAAVQRAVAAAGGDDTSIDQIESLGPVLAAG